MKVDVKLLQQICEIAGAPGFEDRVRKLVLDVIRPHVDEIKVDNMGNVHTLIKGKDSSKKVMLAAHMDEIGFMVNHIDENGFLRFNPLGGFDPKTLTAQRVIVHGKKDLIGVMGSKPIHIMTAEERKKPVELTDFFIDLGLPAKEVNKLVSIGDSVTRERTLIEMGECVNCKSIDNRVSVYILIEALKSIKKPAHDVYGVFTVQEEIGIRGANVAAHQINPDLGIAIDTTIAFDLPGSKSEEQITQLGEGVAIKIYDSSTVCDTRMVKFMKETATKRKIKWQPEILTRGGTDTAGIQRMGKNGAIAGALSIPTRHIHQVIEMAHKKDIERCIELLVGCLEDMDTFDWSH